MKVLIACEESQTVCKAFRALGLEAYSCDIQECSGGHPEWHIQGDALKIAYSSHNGQIWDLMIAHPPCTYMSKAGARWMYPKAGVVDMERLKKAMEAKYFFDKLKEAPIPFIALENPQPLKIVGLDEPDQIIQPYQFGDPFSKKTYIWTNLPALVHTNVLAEYEPYLPSNTGGAKRGQRFMYKSITQKEASKTFPGIADAMAKQWGNYVSKFIREIIMPDVADLTWKQQF
jgi:hypothetical protein